MSCTVPQFCNPPNFAVLFPDLIGPTGPAGSLNIPAAISALGATPIVFLPSVNQLSGVGANALSAIPTVDINSPFLPYMVLFLNAGIQQLWVLNASTDVTGPGVQRPNDYDGITNAKVWTQTA